MVVQKFCRHPSEIKVFVSQAIEKYLYKIDDNTFISFWSLKEWPQTIKEAVGEAQRIIQEREAKLSEKLEN